MQRVWTPKSPQPSPVGRSGPVGWMRGKLFSSPGNTILTLLGFALLAWLIPPFIRWALIDATWIGNTRQVCDAAAASGKQGACWVFINVRMETFLYGFYPVAERWRVNFTILVLAFSLLPILFPNLLTSKVRCLCYYVVGLFLSAMLFGGVGGVFFAVFFGLPFLLEMLDKHRLLPFANAEGGTIIGLRVLLSAAIGIAVGYLAGLANGEGTSSMVGGVVGIVAYICLQIRNMTAAAWRWVLLFTLFPVFAGIMLLGNGFGLSHVETHFWGGFFLTLVVAGTGMGTALPIGILLALGRRSKLPVIRTVCIAFIEFARGVPLVSVLFMASVMFPLFLPENVTFDKLLRALIGIAFFYAAYMAEVVRGGLQAIPRGQYEAAQALGWSYWRMMSQIILPQTLRLVIPGLANNFLSLLKDTTLVAVIGLFDLLGIVKAAMADADWLGFTKESYVFAAVVFWVFCFGISRYCLYLEKKYHTSYH